MRTSEAVAIATRAQVHFEFVVVNLERGLIAVNDYRRGMSAGTGGGGSGRISDPTGNAALSTDEFAQMHSRLMRDVLGLDQHASGAARILHEILDPPPPPKPQQRGLIACANVHGCPDDRWAEPGKRGRCGTCYEFIRSNDRDRRLSGQPRGVRRSA